MACLKCSTMTEDGALLCEACAEASFDDPRFFLNPVLVGQSLFGRMRAQGSVALVLGPVSGQDFQLVPSSELHEMIKGVSIEGVQEDEARAFCERCNTMLAHLGVPLKFDRPLILMTDDAAAIVSTIVKKVGALEEAHPNLGLSDLYLRMGMVYWYAYHGILLRTAPKEWSAGKRALLYGRAKEYLSKVSDNDELRSIADFNLGVLASDAHDWAVAAEHLTRALRHFPGDQGLAESLANAHLELGNQMDAMSIIDDALSSAESPRLWVLKGRVLRNMSMMEESLECLNRALTLDQRFMEAHDRIVSLLREMGRAEDAAEAERQRAMAKTPDLDQKVSELISDLKKASAEPAPPAVKREKPRPRPKPPEEPVTVSYPVELAREALKSGNYDSAIQMAEHILVGEPDSKEAHLVLVEALVATSDLRRAAETVHSYYEKNRDDSSAWYWRGVVADKEGKWGAAVQYYSKSVTLNPSFTDAWLAMGELLLDHDKVSGADESFSRVLQLSGNSPRAWIGKAKAMRRLGRWGAAVQCMDKYNILMPRDRDAWLFKADLLFEKEKHRRAIEAYDNYLSLGQDDSYALGRKGISLNAIGMRDEALRCLEEAVRLDPTNREAAKWLDTLTEESGP